MRKLLVLMSMCLCIIVAHAQNRTITGKVTDDKGLPIPNASIKVKGTSVGTSANDEGVFTLSLPANAKALVVTSVSHNNQEVTIANNSNFTVVLTAADVKLDEVVVTALGIKRNKNTLPYAAQQIKGDDVSATRGNNVASALSGKISGLEIRQGNGIGGSTNVVVRGTKSLTNNNQALFVVDGTPIDNSVNNTSNQTTGRGGYDYGNAAADINPDDIESINVLKGAAASALYGSRAANGVIMITTKKGKKGLGITVNTGVIWNSMDKSTFPVYQKEYGAGYGDGYSKTADGSPDTRFWWKPNPWGGTGNILAVPTTEDASYGAKFDPNLMVYQWDAFFDKTSPYYMKARPWVAAAHDPSSFYENALSTNNSVSLDGGGDKGTYKLGYLRNDERGILPNSQVLKNMVNFGATYNLTDRLTSSATINYTKINGKGRYGTGYDGYNVNQNFRQWYETNMDVTEQKAAYFRTLQNMTWNWADVSGTTGKPIYTNNPYWVRYQNYETDTRSRYFGNVALNYKATDWLNILGRISLDSYDELQEERMASGSLAPAAYTRTNRSFRETNYDLIANFDKNITTDLNLKALAGINIRRTELSSIFATTNGGLVNPGLYAISNSLNPPAAPVEVYSPVATDGYFGGLTLTYKDFLTLDGTIRHDRSSTLPVGANEYNYPAVSGSWLFSKHLASQTWLSSGKIRVNYAQVGNSAAWGKVKDVYDVVAPFNGPLYSLPNTKNNSSLRPENTVSKEIGLEASFLRNRIGFDVTYYHTNTRDQLIPVATTTAIGYSSKFMNAGNIENKGIELSVFATPIRTKDFQWNINVNWTQNRNKVLELYDKSTNLQIASFQGGVSVNATLNQPYGTIQGKTWDRVNGEKLVKSNGRYSITSSTSNVIGNINPDWIGGVYNNFKYKNFSLGFLVDVRQGGDVFSLDMYYGLATGIYPVSAGKNDLGNDSRLPIAQGGGVIMPGVTADGKPNTTRVENIFGTYGYSYNPAANFIYDASYVKLRELTFSYALPANVVKKLGVFKGVEFSVVGRNLWIIHKNLPYADPEENLSAGNAQGYQSGAYPTTRSVGANLKLKF